MSKLRALFKTKKARRFTPKHKSDKLDSLMKSKAYRDPVIEYYMQFVDREALRENLKLTVEERLLKAQPAREKFEEQRYAGQGVRFIKGKATLKKKRGS